MSAQIHRPILRINDPEEIRASDIASTISAGKNIVLQFSRPSYSSSILKQLDALCHEFGENLDVRFYGHYSSVFDCSVVQQIPSVASLTIDCLMSATNVKALYDLPNLKALSVGIYELEEPQLLFAGNFRALRSLTLGETKRNSFDLSPLASFTDLKSLGLVSHSKNIAAISALKQLESLTLSSIKNTVRLDFVNHLTGLRDLRLILGGRTDISEVTHTTLRKLEVIRVRGLEQFSAKAFPALEELQIEDQIRLVKFDFCEVNSALRKILFFNCKALHSICGLKNLPNLSQLRISLTDLDFEQLLEQGLPQALKTFAFYTGKKKLNAEIRQRLDQLGYTDGLK